MPAQKRLWYADGLRFACTRCGRCCGGAPGYVWVSPDEVAAIARRLSLTPEAFQRRYTRVIGKRRSLIEHRNGDCVFLERDADGRAGCSVHADRPLQCRTWPFWDSNLESERAWTVTAAFCPGCDQGPLHTLPVIEEQRFLGADRKL